MKYAERLRALREDNDLTQSDVAKILNTTYQYYSTYESGKRELPFSRAIILAKYYKVSIDYLAGISENKNSFSKPKETKELTTKEKKLLEAYKSNTDMQKAVDKLLNIKE